MPGHQSWCSRVRPNGTVSLRLTAKESYAWRVTRNTFAAFPQGLCPGKVHCLVKLALHAGAVSGSEFNCHVGDGCGHALSFEIQIGSGCQVRASKLWELWARDASPDAGGSAERRFAEAPMTGRWSLWGVRRRGEPAALEFDNSGSAGVVTSALTGGRRFSQTVWR